MPASGKKANKRLARKVYNSDDEADPMEVDEGKPSKGKAARGKRSAPEAVEGQEEDATLSELEGDSEDEVEEGPLDDLRAVERRMRNSARVLANWKELGPAVGKCVPVACFLGFMPGPQADPRNAGPALTSSSSSSVTSANTTATLLTSPRSSLTSSASTRCIGSPRPTSPPFS